MAKATAPYLHVAIILWLDLADMRLLIAFLVSLTLAALPANFGHAAPSSAPSSAAGDCPHLAIAAHLAAPPMDHRHLGGGSSAPAPRGNSDICCFSTCFVSALAVADAVAVLSTARERIPANDEWTVANIVEPAVPPPRT